MKKSFLFIVAVIISISLACITPWWLGSEKHVGDHEIGIWNEWFIKGAPTIQWEFENPSAINLEIVPFNQLNAVQQSDMRRYCKVRHHTNDLDYCYQIVRDAQF